MFRAAHWQQGHNRDNAIPVDTDSADSEPEPEAEAPDDAVQLVDAGRQGIEHGQGYSSEDIEYRPQAVSDMR